MQPNINIFIGSIRMRSLKSLHELSGIGWSKFVMAVIISGIKQARLAANLGDKDLANFISENSK